MRITAGILMIISGLPSAVVLMRILDTDSTLLFTVLFIIGYLSLLGGVQTLRRKHWAWAVTGAICSCICPVLGIPAIVLLFKSKNDFILKTSETKTSTQSG